MSIEDRVIITQNKINNLVNNGIKVITPDLFIKNGDIKTLFEITTDIDIPKNVILQNIFNVKVNNHNIIFHSIVYNCHNWELINSTIINNNGNIECCSDWNLTSSKITNDNKSTIYNCHNWKISNLTIINNNNCNIEYCGEWKLSSSKIINNNSCTIYDCYNWEISKSTTIINNCIFDYCNYWKISNSTITNNGFFYFAKTTFDNTQLFNDFIIVLNRNSFINKSVLNNEMFILRDLENTFDDTSTRTDDIKFKALQDIIEKYNDHEEDYSKFKNTPLSNNTVRKLLLSLLN